jgi:hypothetical protein
LSKFKFNHEVHEEHEVKFSKDFALIFVQLRALCGDREPIGVSENNILSYRSYINWQQAKAKSEYQADNNTQHHDQRHVPGVIGAHSLKGAPETMPDMQCQDNHDKHIRDYINRACKGPGHNLKYRPIGLVHKTEVDQVKNNKHQNNKPRLGHQR